MNKQKSKFSLDFFLEIEKEKKKREKEGKKRKKREKKGKKREKESLGLIKCVL